MPFEIKTGGQSDPFAMDGDDDDDDHDDMAPLVASSTIAPLELESMRSHHRQQRNYPSMGVLFWWAIRISLVIGVALVPLYFRGDDEGDNNGSGGGVVIVNWEHANETETPTAAPATIKIPDGEPTIVKHDHDDNDSTTTLEAERDPVLMGCEPETSFNSLMKKMEQLEQFSPEFCGVPKILGNPDQCECYNPTIGNQLDRDQQTWKLWNTAFENTKEMVAAASRAGLSSLELVLLGDSITEHWNGTGLGRPMEKFKGHADVFHSLFEKENGGKIDAVPLGISAERCANTLYRLQNNGIGDLDPKVFWLLIGTNDIGGEWCGEEVIVAGNIAIVQELRRLRPDATIVINSLLPRPPFLWKHLSPINDRLYCYAESTPQVEFFNATSIFWNDTDHSLMNMMDELHPSAAGSLVWGEAIVSMVLHIIQIRKGTR